MTTLEALVSAGHAPLVAAAKRSMRRVGAAAASVYLPVEGEPELGAAVVAVSPVGLAPDERVPVDDQVLPAAVAYRTRSENTAHSADMIKDHPHLSTFAPFPFTITAIPALFDDYCLGVLTVFWIRMFHEPNPEEINFLEREASAISEYLGNNPQGNTINPDTIPFVTTGKETAIGVDDPEDAAPTISYHMQKLSVHLSSASHTEDATEFAIKRVMSGFGAHAMALSLIEADRLRLVGSANCSREYLRKIDGLHISKLSIESQAIREMRIQERIGSLDETPEMQTNETWVVLPLLTRERAIGACSLAFPRRRLCTPVEESALTALASMMGFAFDRTRTFDAHYTLGKKLQQALLPQSLPPVSGILSTSRYLPAVGGVDLGGDWYDLMRLPDGWVAAVIGDVQGHSTTAAVVMGQLRSAVRAYAAEGHGPGAVLERTNQLLLDLETDLLATCCCLWIAPATGRFQLSTAGHPVPLVRECNGHYLSDLVEVGVPLGVADHPVYQTTDFHLEADALLALFTDGLTYRSEGLTPDLFELALIQSGGELETLGDHLIAEAAGDSPSPDDVALLLLRYEGTASAAHAVGQFKLQRSDLQGVRRARIFLREWLQNRTLNHGLACLNEEAELLMSEVVTNALVHGDSDVDVQLREYPDRLHVSVRDNDSHLAAPVTIPREEDQAEGGRGLLIVAALATSWGNSPNGQGKTVWFDLPVSGPLPAR
ncbi:ATP-binding SpoIIE family protein phosphatase [Streptomyces sp. NPDC006207]